MNLNPIVLSIPIFLILIGVELVVERLSHRQLYRLPDAIANLSCGITSQFSGLFLRVLGIGIYEVLYANFALFKLEKNWIYWLTLFLLVDLAYYWSHRMSHEINLFWGGHVVHHQSEDYNLSVALRQSSFQVVWAFAFSLPLAFIGYDTLDFALITAANTLYQFWIHTETINKMGWIEYVFNTPSHHRVHHGRDPKYIDKNHAGTLIIWDKLFGTFQQEEEHPTYGITKPVNSWNPVWANFSHYVSMSEDLKRIPIWRDKIRYLFNKPGWLPDYLGGYQAAPAIDKSTVRKYDTPAPVSLSYYVLFQYVVSLVCTGIFLFKQNQVDLAGKAVISLLLSFWIVICSVLFENQRWVRYAEWCRIVSFSVLLTMAVFWLGLPTFLMGTTLAYFIMSCIWFYRVTAHGRLQTT